MQRSAATAGSLHVDRSMHAGVVMPWNEAGILECPTTGELPHDLPFGEGRQALGVRVVVLHMLMFFHELRVFSIFGDRREHELM